MTLFRHTAAHTWAAVMVSNVVGQLLELLEKPAHMEAVHLKSSAFILNTHITLTYGGYTYKFKNFAQSKRVIECIREACMG